MKFFNLNQFFVSGNYLGWIRLVKITAFIFLLGCSKQGSVLSKDIDSPETLDSLKISSFFARGGNQRIEIGVRVPAGIYIESYRLRWSSGNQGGSLSKKNLTSTDRNETKIIIEDIKEGKYNFDLDLTGTNRETSKISFSSRVYGSDYASSLQDRTYGNIQKIDEGNGLEFVWEKVDYEGFIGTEIRYTDKSGKTINRVISSDKLLDTLEDTGESQFFEYRSLYLPEPEAIDTFYTDYKEARFGSQYTYDLHYDVVSQTSYYITHIRHVDEKGDVIKLRMGHTNQRTGETVREFANRMQSVLAFNASTQVKYENEPTRADVPSTVAIVEGNIVANAPRSNRYTLGIRDNNELIAYDPGTTAQTILSDGVKNAVTAFVPLIVDHKEVSESIIKYVGNQSVKHPRQVIAQLDNLDILFMTTGGRGYGGKGMTAYDIMRILKERNVKFAYNLDGGGSTSMVIEGDFINWKIDGKGMNERKRPTFLYVK